MLLTERELQEQLHVSRLFIYNYRKRGMPVVRLGDKLVRYRLDDVVDFLERSCR